MDKLNFLYAKKKKNRQTVRVFECNLFFNVACLFRKSKLNGAEFKSKQLVLEEAKTKYKDRTPHKKNSPNHQLKNHYLNITHQHEQQQGHQHRQQQR